MTTKPTHSEEEYFAREDAEKKRKLSLEQSKAMAATDRQKAKDLHFMHCPKCGMKLHTISLFKVDVDKCFNCHGIFLDDGELEKITASQGSRWQTLLSFFGRKDYSGG